MGSGLFPHKTVNRLDCIAYPLVVYCVVHILTILISHQYTSVLQYPKVLRGNGLLDLESVVDVIHLDVFVLIQKFQNLET